MIDGAVEGWAYRAMVAKCRELKCEAWAVGGTQDHVHLLARLHPTITIARLVGEVKGLSSYVVNQQLGPGSRFRWQEGYGAYTLSVEDVDTVTRYVHDQKRHHATDNLLPNLESIPDARPNHRLSRAL